MAKSPSWTLQSEDLSFEGDALDPDLVPYEFIESTGTGVDFWRLECLGLCVKGGEGWTCVQCSFSKRDKLALMSHIQTKHLPGFPGFKCSLCNAQSVSISGMKKHLLRNHRVNLSKLNYQPFKIC